MSSAQLVFKRYETKYLLDAERPAYKEKTRTCRYSTPHPFDPVFVELKKKCDGVVYKRRCGADSVRGGVGRASRDGQSRLFKRRPRAGRRRRCWWAAGPK